MARGGEQPRLREAQSSSGCNSCYTERLGTERFAHLPDCKIEARRLGRGFGHGLGCIGPRQ